MKTYFQISLKVFTILLTVMLVCVGCGKNGNSTSGSTPLSSMSEEDKCNPVIRFTSYKPIYKADTTYNGTICYNFKGIRVFDADGEMKYSDADAEKYYDHYAVHFLCACIIADKVHDDAEMRSYMEEHLFEVVRDLPLDEAYSSNMQETINRIYYNYKDRIMNMSLESRGYGYLLYKYDTGAYNRYTGGYWTYYLRICRDKDSGNLIAKLDFSY